MKTKFIERQFKYDGTQLKSLFAYINHQVQGDSIVAWQGPCDISFEHMLDGEDLLAESPIRGGDMLHFIVEVFGGVTLLNAVALQRLLTASAGELIRSLLKDEKLKAVLRRDGDDLFFGEQKLSISIATVSPVSALIHFAVNITNANTPVSTIALQDLQIAPVQFAKTLMDQFSREYDSIKIATCKVRPTSTF
jgi:hypothetical protein